MTTHELAHVFHLDRSRGLWGGLQRVFGRHGLRLVTSDGQVLHLRFTGKQSDARGDAAHVDISEGLPPPKKWRH